MSTIKLRDDLAEIRNTDAPPGQCWKCPNCESWATMGGNAAFHAQTEKHGKPTLQPQPDIAVKDRIKTKEINILTAENRKLLAALAKAKAALHRIGFLPLTDDMQASHRTCLDEAVRIAREAYAELP